ncbi:MAG: hypothetical protein NVSMB9_13190 [Isosphaeraceae bacterium]
MPSPSRGARRQTVFPPIATTAALAVGLALGLPSFASDARKGTRQTPNPIVCAPPVRVATIPAPERRPFPDRETSRQGLNESRSGHEETGGSWWLGSAGVALALALCGWGSVAARRYLPRTGGTPGAVGPRVVGRASLSARHSVYLLEVGARVLLVGVGPQGAPSLLGDLTAPEDLECDPLEPGAAPSRPAPGPGGGS